MLTGLLAGPPVCQFFLALGEFKKTPADRSIDLLYNMVKSVILIFCSMLFLPCAHAQKQLVLLKRQHVILRLYPGDDIVYREKGERSIHHSFVNNLADTAVVTYNDTIAYHNIDRLYFRQHKFYNVLGSVLVIGGIGYFLIDQINELAVYGNKASLDKRVDRISIPAVIIGLPLMLLRKKSQRLTPKYHLLMVKPGSYFYKPNPQGYQSPFIPDGL